MKLPEPVAWLCTDFDGHFGLGVTKELAKSKAGEFCNDFLPLHPESVVTEFQHRIEALEAELSACKLDAERMDKLSALMFAADFSYGEDGLNVLVFEWPKNVPVGANLRRNVDAAMAAGEPK